MLLEPVRPKDPMTYTRNDFELLEVSLLRDMLRLQFQVEANDPEVGTVGYGQFAVILVR